MTLLGSFHKDPADRMLVATVRQLDITLLTADDAILGYPDVKSPARRFAPSAAMNRIALDTTFLIDLQNERRKRGVARGALDFLRDQAETVFFLPVIARVEYLEGFADPESAEARDWIDALQPIEVSQETATEYAKVTRKLRAEGRLIGGNDLWIGCAAKVGRDSAGDGEYGRVRQDTGA